MEDYEKFGDELVCPHCDHEQEDVWDMELEASQEDTIECQECEKDFVVYVEARPFYMTRKGT